MSWKRVQLSDLDLKNTSVNELLSIKFVAGQAQRPDNVFG